MLSWRIMRSGSRWRRLLLLSTGLAGGAALGVFAACSSSSSSGDTTDGATGSEVGALDAPAGDASSGGDATSDAADGAPKTNPAHVGRIVFTQFTPPGQWHAGAMFTADASAPDASDGCTRTKQGTCVLQVCATPPPPLGTPGSVTPGDIALSGGTIPAGTKLLAVDGGGNLDVGSTGTVVANGDVLLASAPGSAEVPAFSLSVAAMPTYTVTSPACDGGCPGLDRSKDFALKWTGLTAGTLHVALIYSNSPPDYSITCEFVAAAGQGVVPSTLLSELPATANIQLEAVSRNETNAVVGDYGVTFDFSGDYFDRVIPIAK